MTTEAIVAGTAQTDLTPPPGVELMGYGARVGTSTGVHDRLLARALMVAPDGRRDRAVLVISCDLCLMAPAQAEAIRIRIGAETGLSPRQMLIACTHTHSGPDTGLGALVEGRELPEHVQALEGAIVRAGVEACRSARPARLSFARGRASIGKNRRLADGPLDTEVLVIAVDESGGRPMAVLFQHACHPTVLGHDNLLVSADWPGVACRELERATGASALFVLGAHADVDPRTRGLMDALIPGQSRGLGFEAVDVLGREVAEAVLGALDERDRSTSSIAAASRTVELPVQLGDLSPDQARAELERRKIELAELLGVDPARFPRLSELHQAAERAVQGLPLGEARRRFALARRYLRDKTAPFLVGGARRVGVEVQLLRLGEAALLALPAELTTQVGLDWKERAAARSRFPGAVSIGNGWLRYLPHARDLAHPLADQHYEVSQSVLAAGAAERLLEAGSDLLCSPIPS
jgi:hypothetical protein